MVAQYKRKRDFTWREMRKGKRKYEKWEDFLSHLNIPEILFGNPSKRNHNAVFERVVLATCSDGLVLEASRCDKRSQHNVASFPVSFFPHEESLLVEVTSHLDQLVLPIVDSVDVPREVQVLVWSQLKWSVTVEAFQIAADSL